MMSCKLFLPAPHLAGIVSLRADVEYDESRDFECPHAMKHCTACSFIIQRTLRSVKPLLALRHLLSSLQPRLN